MSLGAILNYLQKVMSSGEGPLGLEESKYNSCLLEGQEEESREL